MIRKGEEHFGRYGLRKTSISDLASEVGIAKGSFYLFFDSKETLFFTVLQNYEESIRKDLISRFEKKDVDSSEILKGFMKNMIRQLDNVPFFKVVLNRDEYRQFYRKLSKEQFNSLFQSDVDFVNDILKLFSPSEMGKEDIKYLVALMRSVFLIILQKEILGEDIYLKVADFYIDKAVEEFFK